MGKVLSQTEAGIRSFERGAQGSGPNATSKRRPALRRERNGRQLSRRAEITAAARSILEQEGEEA